VASTARCTSRPNDLFTISLVSEQADSVLSQDLEVRGQTRILRCEAGYKIFAE